MKKFALRVLFVSALALGVLALTKVGGDVFAQVGDANLGGFGQVDQTAGLGVAGAGTDQGDSLIQIIKNAINWLLGLMGLIALVVLLWGGFQMVTAAGDDAKYQNGFKILKQAGVGLVFIGISYFFVSIIFWLIGSIAGGGWA